MSKRNSCWVVVGCVVVSTVVVGTVVMAVSALVTIGAVVVVARVVVARLVVLAPVVVRVNGGQLPSLAYETLVSVVACPAPVPKADM